MIDFCAYSDSVGSDGVLPMAFASYSYAPDQASAGAKNQEPNLYFANVPDTAKYLSVVMDDETEPCGVGKGACVHAGVFDLPATLTSLTDATPPEANPGVTFGGVIAYDDDGSDYLGYGYEGPFPPSGTTHTYKVTVYAHKSPWADYGVAALDPKTGQLQPTQSFGRPPVTRAEVEADQVDDIVASYTLTFTFTAP